MMIIKYIYVHRVRRSWLSVQNFAKAMQMISSDPFMPLHSSIHVYDFFFLYLYSENISIEKWNGFWKFYYSYFMLELYFKNI